MVVREEDEKKRERRKGNEKEAYMMRMERMMRGRMKNIAKEPQHKDDVAERRENERGEESHEEVSERKANGSGGIDKEMRR